MLKLRHIGDVLLSTPVFRALKEAYPGAEIYACVNKGTEQVLEGNEDLSGVFLNTASSSKGFSSLKSGTALARELRRKHFDLCLDLTTSDRSASLTFLTGAQRRIGFKSFKGFLGRKLAYTERVQPVPRQHMVLKHLKLIEPLELSPANPRLHITITRPQLDRVRTLLPENRAYFQVHPISRLAKKNWPTDFMAETVRHLAQRGWLPVLTGSSLPEEMQQVRDLGQRIGEHLNLCGKLSLLESGAVSKNAKCFLGVDTAPMHIAAAAGAPVIALFGPSSETLWAPWCEKKLVLSQEMSCRLPCKDKACQHINCLRTLIPPRIFPAIDGFLGGLKTSGG